MSRGHESRTVAPEDLSDLLRENPPRHVHVENMGFLEIRGEAQAGRLLMAHGAGAGQQSGFMRGVCESLARVGVQTLAFEFRYMQRMQEESRRRPPPKIDQLVTEMARWRDIVTHEGLPAVWLGGKSMGGRVASILAAREEAPGLVMCGYPFHPPGRPDRTRLDHWPMIRCPMLVLQGTRDPFGNREDIESYELPKAAKVHFLEDGDHDWKPCKRTGHTQDALIDEATSRIAAWMRASR
ncbi:alpha/beta family hydrolase [Halomonas shantousis]